MDELLEQVEATIPRGQGVEVRRSRLEGTEFTAIEVVHASSHRILVQLVVSPDEIEVYLASGRLSIEIPTRGGALAADDAKMVRGLLEQVAQHGFEEHTTRLGDQILASSAVLAVAGRVYRLSATQSLVVKGHEEVVHHRPWDQM